MEAETSSRRPLKVRERSWAIVLAAHLAKRRVPPRLISIGSFAAAVVSGGCFILEGRSHSALLQSVLLIVAAAMMQLRLICNLLDGMVAVEGKLGTPDGELYNDLPDRLSDWCLFLAIGFSVHLRGGITIGWCAAMVSVLTAYVRVLGRACGAAMHFEGPMAKQQRMALMCAACVIGALLTPWGKQPIVLYFALCVIIAGSAWTIVRRLKLIADDLKQAKSRAQA